MQEAFNPERGLFIETAAKELYPDPAMAPVAATLGAAPALRFLGAMLGKAMYEGILIEVCALSDRK